MKILPLRVVYFSKLLETLTEFVISKRMLDFLVLRVGSWRVVGIPIGFMILFSILGWGLYFPCEIYI
jgi:hypothetical protein